MAEGHGLGGCCVENAPQDLKIQSRQESKRRRAQKNDVSSLFFRPLEISNNDMRSSLLLEAHPVPIPYIEDAKYLYRGTRRKMRFLGNLKKRPHLLRAQRNVIALLKCNLVFFVI